MPLAKLWGHSLPLKFGRRQNYPPCCSPKLGSNLPDSIPGQSNLKEAGSRSPGSPFSFFSGPAPKHNSAEAAEEGITWTASNAAMNGLHAFEPTASTPVCIAASRLDSLGLFLALPLLYGPLPYFLPKFCRLEVSKGLLISPSLH